MNQQLAMRFNQNEHATFDSFYTHQKNLDSIAILTRFLSDPNDPFLCVWGEPSCGKTHLLTAACAHTESQNKPSAYLSLYDAMKIDVKIIDGLEQYELVTIDDIHLVAGNKAWETALFNLYNQLRNTGKKLLVSSLSRPDTTHYLLPDLLSRLQWGIVYQLHALDDKQKKDLLIKLANDRALPIDDAIVDYLFKRHDRALKPLIQLLERLDQKSLEEKRKLTIPFIQQVIKERSHKG